MPHKMEDNYEGVLYLMYLKNPQSCKCLGGKIYEVDEGRIDLLLMSNDGLLKTLLN
jgi:hypothetical protein